MANTITTQASLGLAGTGLSLVSSGSTSAAQAGTNAIEDTGTITNATSTLPIGSVSTIGYMLLKNTDVTNSIRVGLITPVTSGNAFATLQPGDIMLLPTRQTTIYAITVAGTAAFLLQAVEL